MSSSLKDKTITGMLWNTLQTFGGLIIQLVSSVVLARLLMPSDFGMIAMLNIFLTVSVSFVDGGFGLALIQKKNTTDVDYNTVFFWNLVVSLFFMLSLYLLAPSIALFYSMPLLVDILRVLSITLLINAFAIIPNSIFRKNLDFKSLTYRNLTASAIGTTLAIILAYNGYGVWSLVYSTIISQSVGALMLWYMVSWRPKFSLSRESFSDMFSFGGFLLLTNLFDKIYTNIQGLIIGRVFTADILGFYSKAYSTQQIPAGTLSTVVNSVAFPAFSRLQNDVKSMSIGFKKVIKSLSYLNFPVMVLLAVIARPLFIFLFSEKWLTSVPYFQILCLSGMLFTLNSANNSVYRAMGRGKMFFYIEFMKKIIGITLIIIGIQFGVEGMLWGMVASSYISFFINTYFTRKLINYGVLAQIKDVFIYYILSFAVGLVTYSLGRYLGIENNFFNIIALSLFYISIYLGIGYYFKHEGFMTYFEIVRERLKK